VERIREYNVLADKKVIIGLNVASLPLFLLGAFIFSRLTMGDPIFLIFPFMPIPQLLLNLALFFLAYFLIITIHELIHGLFFKVFSDIGKIKFGFKNGMAYATNPGTRYTWWQFLIIILSPCILISVALFSAYQVGLINATFFVTMASIHFAGCVGDHWYALLILRYGDKNYEDTEVGFSIWSKS
jgi:hypothetical protein